MQKNYLYNSASPFNSLLEFISRGKLEEELWKRGNKSVVDDSGVAIHFSY